MGAYNSDVHTYVLLYVLMSYLSLLSEMAENVIILEVIRVYIPYFTSKRLNLQRIGQLTFHEMQYVCMLGWPGTSYTVVQNGPDQVLG